ncbi:Eco57I restriction-modification methylase domain-containing protein [Campylobacter jejuni]|uniref:type IIG restriction enzyme/methyltransferase n=1 Tax=Campylobacter jejuni TaxID=197 RepID=UPI0011789803|nr:DNA methyltransferase [Campylobacter jejuni]ECP8784925.1 class I SAM-dependent DNA methyltransferase [Campylobacter jejuni]ECR3172336.1 class I SAM-dependent DNA methyltransferase [Campylobacter jejuni]MEA8935960.1 Eco57I restriction-modification methylase domain-containing protein [Campylobacter jejuni]MEA8949099.1 Eco57I restriction-modification methylase domain-containing protein [Campylobacter jejuni]MEA8970118.1 Eco57I restriction-modification methylase domain-containing protein [Campy
MKFEAINEKEFLNPYHRKKPILETELNEFIKTLKDYKINLENNLKNNEDSLVANALSKFFENLSFQCEVKSIHKGNSGIDLALKKDGLTQVIIEAKLPHSREFFSPSKPNCKALHECILYYLRERKALNSSLKHIIITDFYSFFIFKADLFEELFNKNKYFKEAFENFESKNSLFKGNTDEIYQEFEKILNGDSTLKGLFVDLKPILEQDKLSFGKLKPLFKIFSKDCLLGEFNPNDANSLNNAFYKELLYILGLYESKQNSKLIITKSEESKEEQGTFYTAINSKLKEENFETILKLLILWLNRILFLKLIESNLVRFNDDKNLKFLNFKKIPDFDKLSELFFEVLAKEKSTRKKSEFAYLPYLNSSLFEKQSIENTLEISSLSNDLKLFYYKNTVLKDDKCKAKKGQVGLLEYLFEFLDSFDFGSDDEQSEILSQKELISSSVLGNVFEKLNGYKEGSFYTPSFITSYMCKESITKVVLDKFNAQFDLDAKDISELRKSLRKEDKKAQKELLNSIKICDPAVGSGHFLVSALNVMLSIYDELNLFDEEFYLEVQNDEILITGRKGEFIEYKRPSTPKDKAHLIQQELFHTKKDIIENNLFGVDINPNSCEITKLRLWIELLKHSFYQSFDDETYHDLKTLPNIDINIKCGNSLVSYFETGKSLNHYPNIKERINKYKRTVKDYKEGFYTDKSHISQEIKNLKISFKNFCFADKFKKEMKGFNDKCEKYSKKYGNFLAVDDENLKFFVSANLTLFDFDEKEATKEFANLKKEYDNIFNLESNHPFEWRFEFPEILDDDGNFKGFDLIIGNPPYISAPSQLENENLALQRQIIIDLKKYKSLYQKWDLYIPFLELGISGLCKENAICAMIIPYPFTNQLYAKLSRNMITTKFNLYELTDLQGVKVFDNAVVTNCIVFISKNKFQNNITISGIDENLQINAFLKKSYDTLIQDEKTLVFNTTAQERKIDKHKGLNILGDFCYISYGLRPNSDEKTAKGEFKKDDLISDIKDKIHCKEYIEAKDMEKYIIKRIRYLEYNTPRSPHRFSRPTFPQLYENEKIMINTIGKINCILDNNNIIHNHSLTSCVLWINLKGVKNKSISNSIKRFSRFSREEMEKLSLNMNLKYILGILNSKYANILLANIRGDAINIYPEYIRNIPIPKINSKNKKIADELINLVDDILKAKEQDKNANTQELENKINSLVYKLYNLTEEEIKIIEGK